MEEMHLPENPFFTKVIIPDDYFCDRKKETENIVNFIKNGQNIVLKSPRRMGKTSLIMHIFDQPDIRNKYNTLFVDIYGTKNMQEFSREFQTAFMDAPFARTKRGSNKVRKLIAGAYVQMNLSPDGSIDGFQLGLNPTPDLLVPLREILGFLDKSEKPALVVLDEFQTILDYPEKASATIRSLVQKLSNTSFIFCGSSRHMLDKMFEYPNEPFYRSATPMNLGPISLDSYKDFSVDMFKRYKKEIDPSAVEMVYYLFSAGTYDMQEVMNGVFSHTGKGKKADINTVLDSIDDILDRRDSDFRDILSRMNNMKERKTLFCVAHEGLATEMTSSRMISTYKLDNASSVQYALNSLCSDEKNLVKRIGNAYMLRDRFFELWTVRSEKRIPTLLENAKARYERELELQGAK